VAGAFVHATNLRDAMGEEKKLVCYDCGVACDLSAMRDQRLVYLRKLGSEEPRSPAAKPQPRKGPDPRAPARLVQGEARRYRFAYEKLGAAAFLSHLDLIRALPRSFRRLELPLFYSSGFHPKPDMMFGPALSLGVASLCEIVDLKIAADLDPVALLEELTAGAQPGLRFVGGVRLGPEDPGITRVVDVARYVVGIPHSALAERGGEAWLRDRIAQGLAAAELCVVRRIDGIGKRVDVRDFLRVIEVRPDAAVELDRAGLLGDMLVLSVEVDVRGSGGVKIAEVMEAIFDIDLPHRAVRVLLGKRLPDGTTAQPLQLELLRKPRAQPAVTEPQAAL
jgi:radical SAM-linked protein